MRTGGEPFGERIDNLVATCAETLKSSPDSAVLDLAEVPLTWSEQARLMDGLERATGRAIDLRMLRESSPAHQAHVVERGLVLWMRDPAEVERYTRTVLARAREAHKRSTREWPQVLERLSGLAAR